MKVGLDMGLIVGKRKMMEMGEGGGGRGRQRKTEKTVYKLDGWAKEDEGGWGDWRERILAL